ncbi:hypothetical protein Tco_0848856, partial [Tanacetum coccineum]
MKMTIAVPLLSAAIMSSTPGPSILTYDTILSESKLRKAWLNCTSYFRLQPAFQNEESMSTKRRMFLLTVDSVLPDMDYFISVHSRSNVRFSALFPDTEEKSSVYPYNFPSMILQKIIWISHGGFILLENQSDLCFHQFDTQSTTTSLSIKN